MLRAQARSPSGPSRIAQSAARPAAVARATSAGRRRPAGASARGTRNTSWGFTNARPDGDAGQPGPAPAFEPAVQGQEPDQGDGQLALAQRAANLEHGEAAERQAATTPASSRPSHAAQAAGKGRGLRASTTSVARGELA